MAVVNLNDPRFQAVTTDKQAELGNMNSNYDKLLTEKSAIDQKQSGLVDTWATNQQSALDQQNQYNTEIANQNKAEALKGYQKESLGARADYSKATDQFGINAEQRASQGLMNSSVSENSKVRMFNAMQNRMAIARESFDKATLNINNTLSQAMIERNVKMAEIGYAQLERQLAIVTNSFAYKSQIESDRIANTNSTNDRYYNRSQDVLSQINNENDKAEDLRRYNEQFAYNKAQDVQAQANWLAQFNQSKKASGGSSRSSNTKQLNVNDDSPDIITDANYRSDSYGGSWYVDPKTGKKWMVDSQTKQKFIEGTAGYNALRNKQG